MTQINYLATDPKTAISEVRPWAGALISVGAFKIKRDLRLVNCSKNHGKLGGFGYLLNIPEDLWDNLSPQQIEEAVWADVDNAFSRPVGPNDEYVNYVPTQIIAETFRNEGFDGIAYKSALSEKGYNVAIFNVNDAEFRTCQLFGVARVDYEFKDVSNPWFFQDGEYFTQVISAVRPANDLSSSSDSGKNPPVDDTKTPAK